MNMLYLYKLITLIIFLLGETYPGLPPSDKTLLMLSACSVLGACFVVAQSHKRPRLITSFYGMSPVLVDKHFQQEFEVHHMANGQPQCTLAIALQIRPRCY